jgi:hypothetical protein
MRLLKQEVIKTLKEVNQEWVNAVHKAEKDESALDTTEIAGKVIDKIADLDDKFEEFRVRQTVPKKKGGLF